MWASSRCKVMRAGDPRASIFCFFFVECNHFRRQKKDGKILSWQNFDECFYMPFSFIYSWSELLFCALFSESVRHWTPARVNIERSFIIFCSGGFASFFFLFIFFFGSSITFWIHCGEYTTVQYHSFLDKLAIRKEINFIEIYVREQKT